MPADFGLHVARHGEVDHQHRAVAPRLQRALHHALADDGQRARRTGDDDVLPGDDVGQVVQRHCLAREAVRPAPRRARACGWRRSRRADAVLRSASRASSIISPAPMNSTFCSATLGKMRSASRTAAAAIDTELAPISVRLRTSFATEKVLLKQLVQHQPQRARLLGAAHRLLHLAEDLRLAQHHGVEPARHAEGMLHRALPRQGVDVGLQPPRS